MVSADGWYLVGGLSAIGLGIASWVGVWWTLRDRADHDQRTAETEGKREAR